MIDNRQQSGLLSPIMKRGGSIKEGAAWLVGGCSAIHIDDKFPLNLTGNQKLYIISSVH